MNAAKTAARRAWRLLPAPTRYWASRTLVHPALDRYRRAAISRPLPVKPDGSDVPIVVAGLFRTASGIGEGARSTFRALQKEGKKPIPVCLSDIFGVADMESPIPLSEMPTDRHGIVIVQQNSPELPRALRALGLTRGRSWYVVGFWAWELSIFPPGWERNFDLVSEIWTPSSFVTRALEQHPNAPPITTKGHPIFVPDGVSADRARFDLPDGVRLYICLADSLSSLDRKNPFAAIAYFRQHYGEDDKALLIVKTRNLALNPRAQHDIATAIGGASNIRVMDASLSETDKWTLLASIDCLISLHRSEGFGLTIAEAIALGKHVIVTGYSGNMDFCTPDNATLVDYELVPCEDRYGRYRYPDAVWAEPAI